MKEKFKELQLSKANQDKLLLINGIISEYQEGGYRLTLRQLYYQLVSRDIIPNEPSEYGKLSRVLKEGRMAGVVDWDAIEDRLRVPSSPPSWNTPREALDMLARIYQRPRMEDQETYLEVWVEKDALSGVLSRVTRRYHIPIMVNRGYSSVTAMHDAWERFDAFDQVKVIYLGDYDPSGLDMIRDIRDRITEFGKHFYFEVLPVALTWEQIEEYVPPPNPAKLSDPRAKDFIAMYGSQSWEVDALRPEVLDALLDEAIRDNIDTDLYDATLNQEGAERQILTDLKQHLKK